MSAALCWPWAADAGKADEGWRTLENGNRVQLDANGKVISGPKIFVGKHISQCGGPIADTTPDVAGYEARLAANGGDHYKAAHEFFTEKLQGHSVKCRTTDGEKEAQFTGGTWQEIKRDMKNDPIKAALVPHMPDIVATGQYRENALHKERTDGARAFHEYRKTVQTAEGPREAIVDVVDRQGAEPATSVYGLTREGSKGFANRQKKKSTSEDSKAGVSPPSSGKSLIMRRNPGCCDANIHPPLEIVNLRVVRENNMPQQTHTLTLDASPSRRRVDENGFLHVASSHVTKEQVAPYHGREIPDWQALGLDPERLYWGYRPAAELARAVPTINGLPILWGHSPESAEEPQVERRIGSMGTDAAWRPPYLDNSLIFTVQEAIDAITSGRERELSLSYRYDPDFSVPGTFEGQPYDFVMRNIRGNHLALVPQGRAGADVLVADAAPNAQPPHKGKKPKEGPMKKLHRELKRLLRLAQDAEAEKPAEAAPAAKDEKDLADIMLDLYRTDPETGEVTELVADEDKAAKIRELVGKIAGKLTPEEVQAFTDALTDLAYSPATGDSDTAPAAPSATDAELKSAMDKCGLDADDPAVQAAFAEGVKYGEKLERNPAEREKLDKEHEAAGMKAAMGKDNDAEKAAAPAVDTDKLAQTASDAALRRFQSVLDAQAEVRPHVGEMRINLAHDSADTVYGAALDALGVDRKGTPAAAWRGMFRVAVRAQNPGPQMAADAALPKTLNGLNKVEVL